MKDDDGTILFLSLLTMSTNATGGPFMSRSIEEEEAEEDPFLEVEIILDGSSDITELIQSLRNKESTKLILKASVSIHSGSVANRYSREEVSSLFEALGSLSSLRHMAVSSRVFGLYELPVEALCSFWRGAKQLETFFMRIMTITSSNEEEEDENNEYNNNDSRPPFLLRSFEEFGEALRNHRVLKEFRIESCQLSEELQESCALDPLVHALATIPTLQVVSFTGTRISGLGILSGESLGSLCQSATSLKSLSLRHFRITEEHTRRICPAIAASTTLKELTLGKCQSDNKHLDASMAQMLRDNSSLERFCLQLAESDSTAGGIDLVEMAEALESNVTLKELTIWGATTEKSQKSFVDMIQINCTLENLWLDETLVQFQSEIFLYVSLNQAGRRRLLEDSNATKNQWVNVLISGRNSLDSIFYLLSMNPLLCNQDQP
jgi:hypothetical protein